jgi:N-acetylglucosamine-6-sulfatase
MVTRSTVAIGAAAAAVAAVAVAAGGAEGTSAGATASTKPNIVFVLVDDMSSNLLRYMPNARKLAADGMSFSRYIVSDSLCCPSRSTTFTGRLPHNTGVFTNRPPDGGYETFKAKGNESHSYGVALQQAGYRTAMMGKYLNGYKPRTGGVPRGWDEWDVTGNGYREFNYALNENGAVRHYGSAPQDYLTDVLAAKGRSFINTSIEQGKPFALEIATFTPHAPSVPAPRDRGKLAGEQQPRVASFNRANIDAPQWLRKATKLDDRQVATIDRKFAKRARSLIAVDNMLGQLRRQLKARGVADNTYVVFSSDNGFHLGQHQLAAGKQTAFDHDIRVPLIVDGPGVRRGATASALAQNSDLTPTFEQIAGRSPDPTRDGRSLLPLLRSADVPGDWRNAALVEHHGPDLAMDDPDRQPAKAGNPTTYTAIRTAHATYVEYRTGEREYYDNQRDPQQRRNVYRSLAPTTKQRLHARVSELRDCSGARECASH